MHSINRTNGEQTSKQMAAIHTGHINNQLKCPIEILIK